MKPSCLFLSKKNEIAELKFRLQKTQAEKSSRLEDSLFSPQLYKHYQNVAVTLSKSSIIPTAYKNKPEDIFVAMAMGYQLGFPVEQSLQDIAVINGRPCLWGDGLLSLALNHPECESIEEERIYKGEAVIGFKCTVKRKGHKSHTQTFTLQNAEHAGLLRRKGVWETYPVRMLQMRARSLALRDKFADALRGLRIAEVEQDDGIIDIEPIETKSEILTRDLKEKSAEKPSGNKKADQNAPASSDDLAKIEILMAEMQFDEKRKEKALSYCGAKSFDELTKAQADALIVQLENM